MSEFEKQDARGKIGEKAAEEFLQGIDFENLRTPVVYFCQSEHCGRLYGRDDGNAGRWVYQSGNNTNKDFIEYRADGRKIWHEIKTDYRAYGDNPGEDIWHTGNLLIEVDNGCIENLDEVKKGDFYIRPGKSIKEEKKAWFNTIVGGHADWYHFYLPLFVCDDKGAKIKAQRSEGIILLSDKDIEEFRNDVSIPGGGYIVTEAPLSYFMSMTGDKLKRLLENIAGVHFADRPQRTELTTHVKLPIGIIRDRMLRAVCCKAFDGKLVLIPVPECVLNRAGEPGKEVYYMHEKMKHALKATLGSMDGMPLGELDKTGERVGMIQRKDIQQYSTHRKGAKYIQPFSTLRQSERFATYSPAERPGS